MGRYKTTGAKAEVLAYQCAVRLLRGESPVTVESSLAARGISNTEVIMEMAFKKALDNRDDHGRDLQ